MKSIIFFLCLFPYLMLSQVKGDYVWINGGEMLDDLSAVHFHVMDFNNNPQEPEAGIMKYGFWGQNSSVSDDEGNLLFYTNGCAIFNRNFEVMPNGDSIDTGNFFSQFVRDCIFGIPGFQSALILQDPGYEGGYYVINTQINIYESSIRTHKLRYSYVNMSLDNGMGDVVEKDLNLYGNEDIIRSYLTAITDDKNEGWWVLYPKSEDKFLTFHIGKDSIRRYPDQDSNHEFTRQRTSAAGTARFSPDGTKYALYNYSDQLHVYDFDRSTGQLSNHQLVELFDREVIEANPLHFASVEWSPNGRFIYCASYLNLHQIDTWESNLQDGIRHIDEYNGTLDPFPTELFLMVQAPDCKIYMAPKNGSYSMHVINKPDELGKDCDFVQNAIKLPNATPGTLPNFPRYRVDEEEKCNPGLSSVMGDQVLYRQPLKVYPNPSHGQYMVQVPEAVQRGRLVVRDLMGRPVFTREIHYSLLQEIDISHLPAGHYHVELHPADMSERVYYGTQVIKL
jgi:hypothetical protein